MTKSQAEAHIGPPKGGIAPLSTLIAICVAPLLIADARRVLTLTRVATVRIAQLFAELIARRVAVPCTVITSFGHAVSQTAVGMASKTSHVILTASDMRPQATSLVTALACPLSSPPRLHTVALFAPLEHPIPAVGQDSPTPLARK